VGNMIGVVKCFYDYPNNPCLGILKSGNQSGETLLPLHEDFILNFDSQKKEIVVELPEGLLDI
jgi:ribosomal 30S subunit maturation factor RimM